MDLGEMYAKWIGEVFEGIKRGDFIDYTLISEQYRYGHLAAFNYIANKSEAGRELYGQLYDQAVACGKDRVWQKQRSGQKIKVAFLAISAAEWPAEDVYRTLCRDDRLECYVVVCPQTDKEREARNRIEEQTYHFFQSGRYDVRRVYNSEEDTYMGWDDIGGMPDIVVHLTSWYRSLPEQFWMDAFPLHVLNCYIPYGMYVADSMDGNYVKQEVYNRGFCNLQWKIYIDAKENVKGYEKYGLLQGKNVCCSGYTKMDFFYEKKEYGEEQIREIWKIPNHIEVKEMKRLIIAPHHSIESSAGIEFSTFTKNAYFWLELAKKYQDKITFIFKPHPNLRAKTVQAHFFESFEEYDDYLAEWNSLPNAKAVEEKSYLDIFATSDGMIMDSCSFIGEYMYVNKPLLFLTRPEQAFNRLGQKIMPCYYKADGGDYAAIEQFITHVILEEKDYMGAERTRVFEETLDYFNDNGCLAFESVCRDILGLLG